LGEGRDGSPAYIPSKTFVIVTIAVWIPFILIPATFIAGGATLSFGQKILVTGRLPVMIPSGTTTGLGLINRNET